MYKNYKGDQKYMGEKFALLIGNGFTIDFLKHNNSALSSSLPLRNFGSSDIDYSNFLNAMPSIKKDLIEKKGNDFDLINKFSEKYKIDSIEFNHLRQFLSLSYSKLHFSMDDYEYNNWKWSSWLHKNRNNLLCSISLNYDLLLEKTLSNLNIKYFRVGTDEPLHGSILLKPHGSIDFDMPSNTISMPTEMRLLGTTFLNDAQYVRVINHDELLYPRVEADIIPPTMYNFQKKLSWIENQFKAYERISTEIDKFVLLGVSYWSVDRPEIDFFLEKLPKNAKVYIGNKDPSPDLIKKLFQLHLKHYTFEFHEVPWD